MSAWRRTPDGDWAHRPWWKVAVNTVLRALQPQARKLVVYTRCREVKGNGPPVVLGYGIGLVLHLPEQPGPAPGPRSNARE